MKSVERDAGLSAVTVGIGGDVDEKKSLEVGGYLTCQGPFP